MKTDWRLAVMALLPKNHLSRWVGWAVRRKWPFGLHRILRDALIQSYRINVGEAELPLGAYPTFGSFFIRKLKPGSRPVAAAALVSPVDGMATLRGSISASGTLLQAKGIEYSLRDFLPPSWSAQDFEGGTFMTLYLAPHNYHRIHSPCDATVTRLAHIPGVLWPVNTWSVAGLPDLFVRNERVLVGCESANGPVVVALIGATNVGRITLDAIPSFYANTGDYHEMREVALPNKQPFAVGKGQGLACFEMGSTVVLLLAKSWSSQLLPWTKNQEPKRIRMGEALVLE
jgi:phosphatidylserine decarboxylase